jgi:hypothetical protein
LDISCSILQPNALAIDNKAIAFTSAFGSVSSWASRPLLKEILLANSSCDQPWSFRRFFTLIPKFIFKTFVCLVVIVLLGSLHNLSVWLIAFFLLEN